MAGSTIVYAADLAAVINGLLKQESVERFSLLGYSMGGKIALQLVPHLAKRLDELFLLAGSGIRHREWVYQLPVGLVKRLGGFVDNPKTVIRLVKWLHGRGRLAPSIYDMYRLFLENERRRKKLFFTWLALLNFRTSLAKIVFLLNKYRVKVHFLYGVRDAAIPIADASFLCKQLNHTTFQALDADHWLVNERLNGFLEKVVERRDEL